MTAPRRRIPAPMRGHSPRTSNAAAGIRNTSNDGSVELVVRFHRNAAGMSDGCAFPLRHDRNSETTTAAAPANPMISPEPIGLHERVRVVVAGAGSSDTDG